MKPRFKRAVLDIETNNLLNPALDFLVKPLALKPHVRLWCIAVRDFDNLQDVVALALDECTEENLKELLKDTEELIFHNGIGFDMVMLQLFNVLKYRVGYESDTIFGDKPIRFIDTLLLSKMLRPDRFGGHSVEAWGRTLGVPKIDFHEFEEYSDEMVEYCKGDTLTQAHIYQALLEEMGSGWDKLTDAYRMEIKLMDLTVRQELRGFHFDKPLAEQTVKDFTDLLEEIRSKVDPILPARPLNKGEQKTFVPPKLQFKTNGEPSAVLIKFVERIGATLEEEDGVYILDFEGKRFTLPYHECIKETMPGSIDNLDYLKAYLLDLGWDPIEWKERDLTKDSGKNKLSGTKLDETILRYIESTLSGPYKKYRLDIIGVPEEKLTAHLFAQKDKFSLKVPVSPLLRIGTEKKLCDNLKAMGEEASFALDVVKYLTFKHRKNSLAGGKSDEEGEPLSGYLSNIREDGRIGTPADTCGANGGRYKHRVVCNVPRVSSPGGQELRSVFGCGPGRRQFGFDFASLEARTQGHYVIPFHLGEELAESLIAEKPNDCFDEQTHIFTKEGWLHNSQITYDTLIANWNPDTKVITYSKPNYIVRRNHVGTMITVSGSRLDIRVTPNHVMSVFNRDLGKHIKVLARDLKHYVIEHPNSFIPANGYEIDGNNQSAPTEVELVTSKKCGSIYRSTEYADVCRLATDNRLKGSSSLILQKDIRGTVVYQTTIGSDLNVDGFKLIPEEISSVNTIERVWCVSVPTQHVMVKRNDSIYMTGNCHSVNARKLGILRDAAKSFSYATMYGAQPTKLAKMLRIPVKEAERLYDAYWEAVPALKELKDRLETYWKKTGKQYIMGIDGRKLYVRSQHSLVNLLLQSAGALCVKYTIVNICRRLEALGLLGDPLLDTEEDMLTKYYLMIVYHDEAQFDCPENAFNEHYFDTEEEAKAAKKLVPDSSAVGHDEKGFYFSDPSLLSTIINEEIFRVCMDLDLRVPLGMEYITGSTWGECH